MDRLFQQLRIYRLALIATGVALAGTLITLPLSSHFQRFPFALFIAAVMVCAWRGGRKQGLAATGLATLALLLLYLASRTLREAEPGEHFLVRLGMFVLIGVLAGYLSLKCREAVVAHDRFHDTLTTLGEALIFTDQRGTVTYLNSAAQALTGLDPVNAEGKALADLLTLLHEDTRQPQECPAIRILRDQQPFNLPSGTLLVANGMETPIEGKVLPLRDIEDRPVGVALAFHTAAARRQAEQELRQREERLRAALGAAPAGLLLLDAQGRCLFTNRACQSLGGFTFDEGLGQGWTRCIHLEDRDAFLNDWAAALQAETTEFRGEFRLQGNREQPRWLRLRSVPMFTDLGQVIGHVALLEEITELKMAARTAQESTEQLAAAGQKQKQIEEALGRLREELQRQMQAHAESLRASEDKVKRAEAARAEAEEAQRQAEETLNGAQLEFARLMDEHLAAKRQAEEAKRLADEALRQAREDYHRQLEEHAAAREDVEEALRRHREEFDPKLAEHESLRQAAETALQAARDEHAQQMEKLTQDFLQEMAALEEKLGHSQRGEESAKQAAEDLRQQLASFQSRWSDLEKKSLHRSQALEALGREKGVLETLIHHAPDGVCAFDRDGRYTFWNPTMEQLTGIERSAALGRSAAELFALNPEGDETGHVRETLEGKGGVIRLRAPAVFGAADPGWLEKSYAPIHGPDGAIIGGVAIVRSIPALAPPVETPSPAAERTEPNGKPAPEIVVSAQRRLAPTSDWLAFN
jgi:PAS domain S-box-containing protein